MSKSNKFRLIQNINNFWKIKSVFFLSSRKGDFRNNPLKGNFDILKENIFYFTCIDKTEQLFHIYQIIKNNYNCVYQKDVYTNEQWLEIMLVKATKANAVLQLKELFDCEKTVAFGDGKIDISLFNISDECYAVSNAVDELKEISTGIIGSNNEDSAAKWLLKNSVF